MTRNDTCQGKVPNQLQQPSTRSDNGSPSNRRRAIILTNADPISLTYICGARGRWVKQQRRVLGPLNDVIMSAIASQITSLTIVYSTVYSGADQRKHQSSASLAFVQRIHRWPVNSHKGSVTRIMLSFDDVIMTKPYLLLRWSLYRQTTNGDVVWYTSSYVS